MRFYTLLMALPLLLNAELPSRRLLKNDLAEPPKPSSLLPSRCNAGRVETSASLLVWQAFEDGLEFAAENTPRFASSSNIPTDISADLVTLDFPWKPAFKFLLGYHFPTPDWDLNARWTCFYSKSQKSANQTLSSTGAGLFPLWIPQQAAISSFPVYGSASGMLLLHLNTVDIELHYQGGISRSLFLTLNAGLKALVIGQTFRASYSDGFNDGVNQMISSRAVAKNECRGLGPRAGFGSKWILPRGWSLIAEAAGSFALSMIGTKREDHSTGSVSGIVQNISAHFKEDFWVWRPVLEARAGAEWTLCFGKQRKLSFGMIYEMQHYWEQNMMTRYTDEAIFYGAFNSRGDLTLQGVSLTISLGY